MKEIEISIKNILMDDWDPIGVNDTPYAKAEYDGYALMITGMLYNGATEDQIVDYLNSVVSQEFGLIANELISKSVAKKIFLLELKRPYRNQK